VAAHQLVRYAQADDRLGGVGIRQHTASPIVLT
jgi:hypothetical protein